jgi:hypothetical protein
MFGLRDHRYRIIVGQSNIANKTEKEACNHILVTIGLPIGKAGVQVCLTYFLASLGFFFSRIFLFCLLFI